MEIIRKETKKIQIGNQFVGGNSLIPIQSMTNTDTRDSEATIKQIKELTMAGCDIVRVAVPDQEAALSIRKIKKGITIPLVADIHFDHRLALTAIDSGVDKLRINPGNIGSEMKIKEVVQAAKDRKIPIRIGVNGGSLEKDLLVKHQGVTAAAMVESAERHIHILEKLGYEDIIVSMKSSDVKLTIDSYMHFSQKHSYPLHLGITEAGILRTSAVKSALGLGHLLINGIGDTIRISVTGNPVEEIQVAQDLFRALGLETSGESVEIISCPTCGRTEIELINIANELNERVQGIKKNLKVAVMGCVVNGPGEGKEADIGIAGGRGKAVLFKKGKVYKTIQEENVVDTLLEEIKRY